MFNSRAEYNNIIDIVFKKFGKPLTPIFNLNAWFIIKIQLSYQLHLCYSKGFFHNFINYEPGFFKTYKNRKELYDAFRSLVVNGLRLLRFRFFINIEQKDSLFLGYLVHNRDILNKSQNIYLNPFIEEQINKNHMLFYLDSNNNKMRYRQYVDLLISWYRTLFCLKLSFSTSKYHILRSYGLEINEILEEEMERDLDGLDKFLADRILEYIVHKSAYKQFLKKVKPNLVFSYSYYDNKINAMFGAANSLKIKTIEYQHSAISNSHFAYSKWINIDEIKNHFPSNFYVWNTKDKEILEANFKGDLFRPNILIKGMVHLNIELLKIKTSRNKLLICLQGIWIPKWLEEFIINDNHYEWYIRLHPRYPNDKQNLEQLDLLQKFNVNTIDANSLNIEELIRQSEILFTCFSGTALEAYELGTKVFIFGNEGKLSYSKQIEDGEFVFVDNEKELNKKLKSCGLSEETDK